MNPLSLIVQTDKVTQKEHWKLGQKPINPPTKRQVELEGNLPTLSSKHVISTPGISLCH